MIFIAAWMLFLSPLLLLDNKPVEREPSTYAPTNESVGETMKFWYG